MIDLLFKRLLPLALAVMLTGCAADGGGPTQQALDFRTALMDSRGCTFTADLTADVGGRVYQFTLDCAATVGGPATLTVTAPASIAGITARVDQTGAALTFDGTALALGTLADGETAPLLAAWLLPNAWTSDYIDAAGADGDLERIAYLHGYGDEALTIDAWLDEQNIPVRCEISYDGVRCLTAEISGFTMQS